MKQFLDGNYFLKGFSCSILHPHPNFHTKRTWVKTIWIYGHVYAWSVADQLSSDSWMRSFQINVSWRICMHNMYIYSEISSLHEIQKFLKKNVEELLLNWWNVYLINSPNSGTIYSRGFVLKSYKTTIWDNHLKEECTEFWGLYTFILELYIIL